MTHTHMARSLISLKGSSHEASQFSFILYKKSLQCIMKNNENKEHQTNLKKHLILMKFLMKTETPNPNTSPATFTCQKHQLGDQ